MKKLFYIILTTGLALSMSCSTENADSFSNAPGGSGTGGSLARFAIVGNTLFTVTPTELKSFNISNPASPVYMSNTLINTGIETIFPKGNYLFIGSENGMYIYDVSNPLVPKRVSTYLHVTSCDPVVANDEHAFVTLRSSADNGRCNRAVNELHVIDITNINNLVKIADYPMTFPIGLGIDTSKNLFVCDAGLKIFDANNVSNLKLKSHFNISATDVIPYNNRLMVIGNEGLYQYAYQNDSISFLSLIPKEN